MNQPIFDFSFQSSFFIFYAILVLSVYYIFCDEKLYLNKDPLTKLACGSTRN